MHTSFRRIVLSAALSGLALVASHTAAAQTPTSPTAIELSIGGIGPGVDATAFKRVKLLISDAVFKGTIDYFDVYGYGKEGGFSACMEKGRFAADGNFEVFLKALRAIKPNRSTTAYSVNEVTLCAYPTTTLP